MGKGSHGEGLPAHWDRRGDGSEKTDKFDNRLKQPRRSQPMPDLCGWSADGDVISQPSISPRTPRLSASRRGTGIVGLIASTFAPSPARSDRLML